MTELPNPISPESIDGSQEQYAVSDVVPDVDSIKAILSDPGNPNIDFEAWVAGNISSNAVALDVAFAAGGDSEDFLVRNNLEFSDARIHFPLDASRIVPNDNLAVFALYESGVLMNINRRLETDDEDKTKLLVTVNDSTELLDPKGKREEGKPLTGKIVFFAVDCTDNM